MKLPKRLQPLENGGRNECSWPSRSRQGAGAFAEAQAKARSDLDEAKRPLKGRAKDPAAHLEFASRASALGADKQARDAYLNALALGIPNLRDSGLARWKYVNLSYRLRFGAQLAELAQAGRTEAKRSEAGDVLHQLRLADSELRRHVRSDPDDVETLQTMISIAELLLKPSGDLQDQLALAKARRKLLGKRADRSGAAPKDRTGIAFENRCLSIVARLGLRAETTQLTADGGIDILAFSDEPLRRGKYIIQCKDWENPVGEPALRDLLGVVSAEDAVKGVLIASGAFTESAKRFAEGKRLELIDGDDLGRLEAQIKEP